MSKNEKGRKDEKGAEWERKKEGSEWLCPSHIPAMVLPCVPWEDSIARAHYFFPVFPLCNHLSAFMWVGGNRRS